VTNTHADNLLDLILPKDLVELLQYHNNTAYPLWEQRHIDAMNAVCEYVEEVHPTHYDSIAGIHRKFKLKEPDYD
jgi:hypothetical protein